MKVQQPAGSNVTGANRKVLAVDDNPYNLSLLKVLVELEGVDFSGVHSASAFLNLLDQYRPDLLLLDIQLVGMSGYELGQIVRARPDFETTPMIAVTAFASSADRRCALEAGFDWFLTKPLDIEEFSMTIREALGLLQPADAAMVKEE